MGSWTHLVTDEIQRINQIKSALVVNETTIPPSPAVCLSFLEQFGRFPFCGVCVHQRGSAHRVSLRIITMISPIVYWGQTASTVSLRADLKHTQNPKIEIKESELHFTGEGIGARGQNEYQFDIHFFEPVESAVSRIEISWSVNDRIEIQDSFYRVIDRHVEFVLKKKTSKVWPRLMDSVEKPGWLKVDFDKLEDSSDESDVDESVHDWQRASKLAEYLSKGRFETDSSSQKSSCKILSFHSISLTHVCSFSWRR